MKPSGVQLEQPDRPTGAHGAHELVGRDLVVRREHHADAGHDGVELAVVEGQRLGVGHLPGDGQALRLGVLPAPVE